MSATATLPEPTAQDFANPPPVPHDGVSCAPDWPVAGSAAPLAHPPADLIHEFEAQSPALIGLLTALTNGLYLVFWFDRQVRVLGRVLPRRPVQPFWMPLMWTAGSLSAGWFLLEWCVGLSPGVVLLGMLVGHAAQLGCVLMAFQVQSRLNELLDPRRPSGFWGRDRFSSSGTLFMNVIYLQWKINKLRRAAPRGCCRQCGYNLAGLTLPRCPECGTPFDPAFLTAAYAGAYGSMAASTS